MKTTKTILLAAILVFATQFSIAQTANLKGDLNKVDRHRVEMRKNNSEKRAIKKIKRRQAVKPHKNVARKQMQPMKLKKVLVQKKAPVQKKVVKKTTNKRR